jgi:hypothetical protein
MGEGDSAEAMECHADDEGEVEKVLVVGLGAAREGEAAGLVTPGGVGVTVEEVGVVQGGMGSHQDRRRSLLMDRLVVVVVVTKLAPSLAPASARCFR